MSDLTINQFALANSIDPVNDLLLEWQNSTSTTLSINRNTFLGITSQPVGINDTQTLTNKTLTSPTLNTPVLSGTVTGTYTLGGTPTFPSSLATLTGTQTLTNKTISALSNTISNLSGTMLGAGTITNTQIAGGTITATQIANQTITATQIANATITNAQIASGGINFANLLSTIFSGQVSSQANAGTAGGTMYWLNLGGVKILWGTSTTGLLITSTGNGYLFTLPTFFTTVQTVISSMTTQVSDTRTWASGNAYSTGAITTFLVGAPTVTASGSYSIFVIGT